MEPAKLPATPLSDDDSVMERQGIFFHAVADELIADFLDAGHCRQWVLRRLHPKGARCPECGHALEDEKRVRFWENMRIRCSYCGKYFTALTGTFLNGTHLNFQEMVLFGILWALGLPNRNIAGRIGCSPETIRILKNKSLAISRFS